MLDLRQYASLGAALKDALERWPNETCLIEADRDREKVRLTYSDFKEMAQPLCRALEDADFKAGDRAAIIMTNQSKWLISAYSIFFCGGVLVPLDYKLTAAEHLQLLAHSRIPAAHANGYGLHRVFVGDGRASERMRAHTRRLSGAVYIADGVVSILAGRALFEHSAYQSRD